jgi:cell division protein FtsZ
MPERRARMLSVEEAPVVSVPVVAPDTWLPEPDALPAPAPARFLSQDEDEKDETEDAEAAFFFSSSTPAVATTVSVTGAPVKTSAEAAPELEPEPVAAPSHPQFDEMSEEPGRPPLPTDYASDFDTGLQAPAQADEHVEQPVSALFTEPDEEVQQDLDTPTFLRRLQF